MDQINSIMKYSQPSNNPFFIGLRDRIDAYFKTEHIQKQGNKALLLKAIVLLLLYLLCYVGILTFHSNKIVLAICFIGLGLSGVMIVFNIVHDASHNAIFKKKRWNKLVCYLGDIVGINTYIWDIRHNIQHHSFTNVLGGDLIIENIPLIRLSAHQPHKSFHRYQLYYAPILYMLYSLYWIFIIDFKLFFKREICNLKNINHPTKEWLKLIFFKAFYVFYVIVIPTLYTPLSLTEVLAFFFLMHAAGSVLLSTVALLGHFVEGPSFPEVENDVIDKSWSEHELEATIDFAPKSRIVNWITGGLNTHTVHHLFPRMCHIHYYKVTPIIEQYCLENQYPYKRETLGHAMLSHGRYLKNLSKKG